MHDLEDALIYAFSNVYTWSHAHYIYGVRTTVDAPTGDLYSYEGLLLRKLAVTRHAHISFGSDCCDFTIQFTGRGLFIQVETGAALHRFLIGECPW